MNCSRWMAAAALGVLGAAACSGDSTSSPVPGTLDVLLTTPRSDDGAMVFEITGPAIDTVLPINSSVVVYTRRLTASTVRGVAAGAIAGGALLVVDVPDVAAAGSYVGTVLQVANRQNALQPLGGYGLTVAP